MRSSRAFRAAVMGVPLVFSLAGFSREYSSAETYPTAQITNGTVTVQFYLPDAEKGFYRATRFDWSGVVRSLRYKGHNYFGQWYAHHDPLIHDAITGPVNVFDNSGPNSSYASASVGEPFLRIGVGFLDKPDEARFGENHTYKIVDGGRWTVRQGPDWIEFTHAVSRDGKEGYVYRKTIKLAPDRPEMFISHSLRNTGARDIEATVFNHGFFQLDEEPAGPNLVWHFPFAPITADDFKGAAKIEGQQITYLREIKDGERVLASLRGFGNSPKDNQFSLENKKSGAAVKVAVDRPIAKLTFWSRRMAYSPEASVHLSISPGATEAWQIHYEFYTTNR